VLDLYRFIKLAAIRRVLACFLARSSMSEVLSNKDFASVEEVMDVAGATDAEGRDKATAALRSFRPGLIVNRVSSGSQVNVLYLRKILHQYVGGDLTLLGEIPDDPAGSQAVRKFLPVIEAAPTSEAAKSFLAISSAVEQLITAAVDRRKEQATQSEAIQANVLLSNPGHSRDPQISTPVQSEAPHPSYESGSPADAQIIQHPGS
jgi:flagellar biosynthesis protein FlhG